MHTPDYEFIYHQARSVAERFEEAGFHLYLVGGAVRDLILGDFSLDDQGDLDCTTDALPDEIERIVEPVARAVWTVGKQFGTVAAQIGSYRYEITTHRSESYVSDSRKPQVTFSSSLEEDLSRRDFTINAMALSLTGSAGDLIDPFGGLGHLAQRRLVTPLDPEVAFSEDPLRMMRAARFISRFDLEPDSTIGPAIALVRERLQMISSERVRDELDKLMVTKDPSRGLWFLVETKIFDVIIPEIPALALEQDPVHRHKDVLAHTIEVVKRASPDRILRLAALFHDVGKPATRQVGTDGVSFHFHDVVGARMTRKIMRGLKYSNDDIDAVGRLVELHLRFHTYGAGWNDRAVRRYVRDAGPLLARLNELTLCDATTRNEAKIRLFRSRMEELEQRVAELREREELDAIRPELNGEEVMELLGLTPSREVGTAMEFLMELRMDEGILGKETVIARLRTWWTATHESS